jgi:uncharacterized membrane protein YfcA
MIFTVIASFILAALSGMGVGGGGLFVVFLALFSDLPQITIQGINLLFFIPIAAVSVIIYAFKKQIKWKTVLFFSAAGLVGAAAGVFISEAVGSELLAKIFGGILIAAGIWQAVSAFKKQ